MDDKLQAKLRRLGVVKGTKKLDLKRPPLPDTNSQPPLPAPQSPISDPQAPIPLETLLPGLDLVATAAGACYVRDRVYPLTYQHGADQLGDLLGFAPATAVFMTGDDRFHDLAWDEMLFLDTETTGLGGAGTLAFMVGVAFFERRAAVGLADDAIVLVVRQYFLRDHGDEPALLLLLDELLTQKPSLITFNGRSFDVPLLDGRFVINRQFSPIATLPHLDLLAPSRRLWRIRLGSCALSALETRLLQVERTHDDVPGYLIPALYHAYLNSGDGRELARVFYHNEIDMLSMVTLAARLLRHINQPDAADHPIDLYSLGKWLADAGDTAAAEQQLRLAVAGDLPLALFHQALHRLALLLKRAERREEAVPLWQQIAATSFDDVTAHVELAKHYEWQHGDWAQALVWTEQALQLAAMQGNAAVLAQPELQHRRQRLLRKQAQAKR